MLLALLREEFEKLLSRRRILRNEEEQEWESVKILEAVESATDEIKTHRFSLTHRRSEVSEPLAGNESIRSSSRGEKISPTVLHDLPGSSPRDDQIERSLGLCELFEVSERVVVLACRRKDKKTGGQGLEFSRRELE